MTAPYGTGEFKKVKTRYVVRVEHDNGENHPLGEAKSVDGAYDLIDSYERHVRSGVIILGPGQGIKEFHIYKDEKTHVRSKRNVVPPVTKASSEPECKSCADIHKTPFHAGLPSWRS